jgi:hypothetical protein
MVMRCCANVKRMLALERFMRDHPLNVDGISEVGVVARGLTGLYALRGKCYTPARAWGLFSAARARGWDAGISSCFVTQRPVAGTFAQTDDNALPWFRSQRFNSCVGWLGVRSLPIPPLRSAVDLRFCDGKLSHRLL